MSECCLCGEPSDTALHDMGQAPPVRYMVCGPCMDARTVRELGLGNMDEASWQAFYRPEGETFKQFVEIELSTEDKVLLTLTEAGEVVK